MLLGAGVVLSGAVRGLGWIDFIMLRGRGKRRLGSLFNCFGEFVYMFCLERQSYKKCCKVSETFLCKKCYRRVVSLIALRCLFPVSY